MDELYWKCIEWTKEAAPGASPERIAFHAHALRQRINLVFLDWLCGRLTEIPSVESIIGEWKRSIPLIDVFIVTDSSQWKLLP